MPRVGVHRGDHPIRGHPPSDPKYPVAALVEVLAHHGGHQPRRLIHLRLQLAPIQRGHQRHRVTGQRIHQRLPRGGILVVTHRLTCTRIVIIATQQTPQLGLQPRVDHPQQPPNRRAHQRDGVMVATAS